MSFTEWYEITHKDKWHEDYAYMYGFADKMLYEYKRYCEENNLKPVWNG